MDNVGDAIPCENIPGCSSSIDSAAAGDVVLNNIIMWVFIALGIIAVIILIYGGIQFMLSQGDPGKAQTARMTIIYAIVGIIVVIGAWAITSLVLGAF